LASPDTLQYFYATATKNNCILKDSVKVEPLFVRVVRPNDTVVCAGEPVPLRATCNGNFSWSPADFLSCANCSTTVCLPITSTWARVSSSSGLCTVRDSVFIDVKQKPTLQMVPPPNALCKGESVGLLALSDGVIGWKPSPELSCVDCPNPTAAPFQSSYFVATSEKSGCFRKDSVFVEVHFLSGFFKKDTTICGGNTLRLNTLTNGSVTWSPKQGLSCSDCKSPLATPSGTVRYEVRSQLGSCVLRDSITVNVDSTDVKAGEDVTVLYGDAVILNASGASKLIWDVDSSLSCRLCPNPTALPEESTVYKVRSAVPSNCRFVDSVQVNVLYDCEKVEFPNLFTRNGDGKNEAFGLGAILNKNGCRLSFTNITIFNRWGKEVFSSDQPDFSWPEIETEPDLFFYAIRFKEKRWKGWFEVLK